MLVLGARALVVMGFFVDAVLFVMALRRVMFFAPPLFFEMAFFRAAFFLGAGRLVARAFFPRVGFAAAPRGAGVVVVGGNGWLGNGWSAGGPRVVRSRRMTSGVGMGAPAGYGGSG